MFYSFLINAIIRGNLQLARLNRRIDFCMIYYCAAKESRRLWYVYIQPVQICTQSISVGQMAWYQTLHFSFTVAVFTSTQVNNTLNWVLFFCLISEAALFCHNSICWLFVYICYMSMPSVLLVWYCKLISFYTIILMWCHWNMSEQCLPAWLLCFLFVGSTP